MLKPKKGICSQCDTGKEVFLYKRNPPLCQYHYKKSKKPKTKIKPFSDKRLESLKNYRIKRDRYLTDNPICEVKGCNNATTNLHHKAGRIGSLLSDERYFMACCSECHPKRIHEDPKWARENGYLI
jgi:hypothetical protein